MKQVQRYPGPSFEAVTCCAERVLHAAAIAARSVSLIVLLLAVAVWSGRPANGQSLRTQPVDVTQHAGDVGDSRPPPCIYRSQQWQNSATRDFVVRQASFDASEPVAEAAVEKSSAAPFISLAADDTSSTSLGSVGGGLSDDNLLIQMATWTVVVLCLCVLTILGIRRWQRSRGMLPEGVQTGRIVDTLVLGPGRSISLIQIQGLRALVGCDATGIRTIALASPGFDDELTSALAENQPTPVAVASVANPTNLNS
jgi:flagellar biogenesis protein FliO